MQRVSDLMIVCTWKQLRSVFAVWFSLVIRERTRVAIITLYKANEGAGRVCPVASAALSFVGDSASCRAYSSASRRVSSLPVLASRLQSERGWSKASQSRTGRDGPHLSHTMRAESFGQSIGSEQAMSPWATTRKISGDKALHLSRGGRQNVPC